MVPYNVNMTSEPLNPYQEFWVLLRQAFDSSERSDLFDPRDDESRKEWARRITESTMTARDLVEHCRAHYAEIIERLEESNQQFGLPGLEEPKNSL